MKRYCLSTVIYPGAEIFFDDFFAAINVLPEKDDMHLVIAVHGLSLDECALSAYSDIDASIIPVTADQSLSSVRAHLMRYLRTNTEHEIYVFTDIDDRMCKDALSIHTQTLHDADFSYGDLNLFMENFEVPYPHTYFERADIPDFITNVAKLMQGNFVGLSALAMTRACLGAVPDIFPESVIPLDWWLACMMVLCGMRGGRSQPVTDYRLNHNSAALLEKSGDIATLQKRTEQTIGMLQSLLPGTLRNKYINNCLNLRKRMLQRPQDVLDANRDHVPQHILWYQDVMILSDQGALLS